MVDRRWISNEAKVPEAGGVAEAAAELEIISSTITPTPGLAHHNNEKVKEHLRVLARRGRVKTSLGNLMKDQGQDQLAISSNSVT